MRLKILFLYLMAVIKLDKPYSLFTLDIRLQFRHPCSARTTSKFFNLADSDSKARCRQSNSTAAMQD